MFFRTWLILSLLSPIILLSKEKTPPFLTRVISHKGGILFSPLSYIGTPSSFLEIKDLQSSLIQGGQVLAKNSRGLFLTNLGTGRIYEWTGNEIKGDWKRIDSTFYTGYNFLSFFFPLDSSLYSFGGIGFWRSNGNLRKFNFKSKEWNAEFLNKSIPWHRNNQSVFLYIDSVHKCLYFNGTGKTYDLNLTNTTDSSTLNKIFKIDLTNNQLYTVGSTDLSKIGDLGETPWGVLTSFSTIIDPVNNKIYDLSKNVQEGLYSCLSKADRNPFLKLSFWMDSSIYFVKESGEYDSVVIHQRDLTLSQNTFYTPFISADIPKETNNDKMLFYLGGSALLAMGLVLYRKQQKSPTLSEKQKIKLSPLKEDVFKNLAELNEIEKSLLRLIYERSLDDQMTQIPDINTALGTTNKNIEIQKRLRSDTISSINEKLSMRHKISSAVIQRKRTEFDARSFEYFINKKHYELVDTELFS